MKHILKWIFYPLAFLISLLAYTLSGKTWKHGYAALRYFFVITNGKFNDLVSSIIRLWNKPYSIEVDSQSIFYKNEDEIESAIISLRENGYYKFKLKLGDTEVDEIKKFSLNTPHQILNINESGFNYYEKLEIINTDDIKSPKYSMPHEKIMESAHIQNIIFDKGFLKIATNYLGVKPILDIVTMWWSFPFKGKGASQAAQLYHFDMDRFKFVKFFVYLTDVHSTNGPHCYISQSHKSIPHEIRKDARIQDEELSKFYDSSKVLEIEGASGTLLAVDTRGLHKGKPLSDGERLLFQFQFSNSLFGAPYTNFDKNNISSNHKQMLSEFKSTYKLFK